MRMLRPRSWKRLPLAPLSREESASEVDFVRQLTHHNGIENHVTQLSIAVEDGIAPPPIPPRNAAHRLPDSSLKLPSPVRDSVNRLSWNVGEVASRNLAKLETCMRNAKSLDCQSKNLVPVHGSLCCHVDVDNAAMSNCIQPHTTKLIPHNKNHYFSMIHLNDLESESSYQYDDRRQCNSLHSHGKDSHCCDNQQSCPSITFDVLPSSPCPSPVKNGSTNVTPAQQTVGNSLETLLIPPLHHSPAQCNSHSRPEVPQLQLQVKTGATHDPSIHEWNSLRVESSWSSSHNPCDTSKEVIVNGFPPSVAPHGDSKGGSGESLKVSTTSLSEYAQQCRQMSMRLSSLHSREVIRKDKYNTETNNFTPVGKSSAVVESPLASLKASSLSSTFFQEKTLEPATIICLRESHHPKLKERPRSHNETNSHLMHPSAQHEFDPDSYFMQKCPPRYRRFSQYKGDYHRTAFMDQELSRSNSSPNRPGCLSHQLSASEEGSYFTLASLSPRVTPAYPPLHPHHPRQYSEPEGGTSKLVSVASMLSLTNSIDSGYTPTTPSSSRNTTSVTTASATTADVVPVFFASPIPAIVTQNPSQSLHTNLIQWQTVLMGCESSHEQHDLLAESINELSVHWCRYRHHRAGHMISNAETRAGGLHNSTSLTCQTLLLARRCPRHLKHLWECFITAHASQENTEHETMHTPFQWVDIDLDVQSDESFNESNALKELQQYVSDMLQLEGTMYDNVKAQLSILQNTANELQVKMRQWGGPACADKLQRLMKSVTSVLHLLCVHGKQVTELDTKKYIQEKIECCRDAMEAPADTPQVEQCHANLQQAKSMATRILQDDKRLLDSILHTAWEFQCLEDESEENTDAIIHKTVQLLTQWAQVSLRSELLQVSMKQDQILLRTLQLFT